MLLKDVLGVCLSSFSVMLLPSSMLVNKCHYSPIWVYSDFGWKPTDSSLRRPGLFFCTSDCTVWLVLTMNGSSKQDKYSKRTIWKPLMYDKVSVLILPRLDLFIWLENKNVGNYSIKYSSRLFFLSPTCFFFLISSLLYFKMTKTAAEFHNIWSKLEADFWKVAKRKLV